MARLVTIVCAGWVLRGTYKEVRRAERLAFTWSWDHDDIETDVAIDCEPSAAGTRLRLGHHYSSEEEREGYQEGWLHFLGVLEEQI